MILSKLLYLIFIIVLTCFWVLYIDSIALVMLLCALCLPVLLKMLMMFLKHNSEASLSCSVSACTSGESIPVTITIANRLPFSFSQLHAVVELKHSLGVGMERMHLQFPLHGRNTTKMTFYIHADFCGNLDVSLKKLYVLDYLHLFRTNLTISQRSTAVLILPQRIPLRISELSDPVYCAESDVFGDKPGDDPSEIFGLHEYAPGDAVSRIHWKLSSKSDQILVKEFSTPVQKSILLLLDLKWDNLSSQQRMRETEAILSVFYSLVCNMVEQKSSPMIFCYNTKAQQMQHYSPTSIAGITEMFRELYFSLDTVKMDIQALLNETVGRQYSSLSCVTNDLSELLLTAIDQQIDANQRNIVFVSSHKQTHTFLTENSTLITTTPDDIKKDVEQLLI